MRSIGSFAVAAACLAVMLVGGRSAHAQPAAPAKAFVEGGLAYGFAMSNADFIEVNNGTALDSPGSSGPAFDVAGGYALVPNLFVMGDLQHARASTIEGRDMDGDTEQYFVSYTSFSVGLRVAVPAGPGEVYAQMSLGLALPFETEREQLMANGDSRVTTIEYNTGLGGRGEMGYHFDISDRMYLAAGLRLQAFATDNEGRRRVQTDQPGNQVQVETYSTNPNAGGNTRDAEALSVQDMRLRIGFGLRF